MSDNVDKKRDRLMAKLSRLPVDERDRGLVAETLEALDVRYHLYDKMAREPRVAEIIEEMFRRLVDTFGSLGSLQNKKVLDLACGSNTSRAPGRLHFDTPFGEIKIGGPKRGYAAQFEPWFCRILHALGAEPVGVDVGDLEAEAFIHHRVDLAQPGALDFLPSHSFDAIQDSRLFGSPEFTAHVPKRAERWKVAQEIRRQEQRLLKPGGILIHSDAAVLSDAL
jgi:2-polyprenyl-3-methyl-5-hydroxy-6-metoxy-1,4-benzoquinol methylase